MAKKKKSNSNILTATNSIFNSIGKKPKNASKNLKEYPTEERGSWSLIRLSSVLKALGILFILIGVLELFTLFESGGYLGTVIQNYFISIFGLLGYCVSFLFLILGFYSYKRTLPKIRLKKVIGILGAILSGTALPNLLSNIGSTDIGGLVGNILAIPFINLFSYYPSILFLTILFIYSIALIFEYNITSERLQHLKDIIKNMSFIEYFKKTKGYVEELEDSDTEDSVLETLDIRDELLKKSNTTRNKSKLDSNKSADANLQKTPKNKEVEYIRQSKIVSDKNFTTPPLSLLEKDSGKASVGDTKANMSIIKRTLSEFGISVEMDEVSIGPSVTRYTLKPAQGVKLSRIAGHRQELAYALRAESIRIEAPIPGKALVGIEIPNEQKSVVGLGSLLSESGWSNPAPLLVALGKGISGNALYSNLAKMPHLLIAGTTGSGKSVMVHAIINSLLFRNSPQALKFIMVDPKKVELTIYNNIPHLYTPVITNAKLAIRTLNWAVNEMEHRYDILEENGERDIASYHKNIYQRALASSKNSEDNLPPRMPYIVIIIDELADIMMSYPKELEAAIVRLAQKSRAVGIHLILSTQRPSVNVITGLIKANIPSRIALKVASQVDSRTIIDTAGAEQLLGQGDLLFTSSENPKQERVQSAFVSDNEVKRVVEYLKNTYKDMLPDEINIDADTKGGAGSSLFSTELGSVGGGDTDDDLFEEAKEIVISSQKASTSYLQRRLKIGYSRAARLMDMLEEQGIIGAGDGAKAREVLRASDEPTESEDLEEESRV